AYGWTRAGLVGGHPRKTFAVIVAALLICGTIFQPRPQPLQITKVSTINTTREINELPADAHVMVVHDATGESRRRPIETPHRIPVLYPNRDGDVTVYSDGTQHAADGRF